MEEGWTCELNPVVELEDLSFKHLNGIYSMYTDPGGHKWLPTKPGARTELDCLQSLREWLARRADQSWHRAKAIISADEETGVREMVGTIFTDVPTPVGLSLYVEIHSERRRRGYATSAVKLFLEEYFTSEPQAPMEELYLEPSWGSEAMLESWRLGQAEPQVIVALVVLVGKDDVAARGLMDKFETEQAVAATEELAEMKRYRLRDPFPDSKVRVRRRRQGRASNVPAAGAT